jgi:anti-sigma B factor antagonist
MTPTIERSKQNGGAYFAADVDVAKGHMTLHGEVDIDTAPLLAEAAEILITGGPSTVTICLARLDFLDAAGLAALVRVEASLNSTGRRLVLTDPQPRVARVFECTGLGRMLGSDSRQAG